MCLYLPTHPVFVGVRSCVCKSVIFIPSLKALKGFRRPGYSLLTFSLFMLLFLFLSFSIFASYFLSFFLTIFYKVDIMFMFELHSWLSLFPVLNIFLKAFHTWTPMSLRSINSSEYFSTCAVWLMTRLCISVLQLLNQVLNRVTAERNLFDRVVNLRLPGNLPIFRIVFHHL